MEGKRLQKKKNILTQKKAAIVRTAALGREGMFQSSSSTPRYALKEDGTLQIWPKAAGWR